MNTCNANARTALANGKILFVKFFISLFLQGLGIGVVPQANRRAVRSESAATKSPGASQQVLKKNCWLAQPPAIYTYLWKDT